MQIIAALAVLIASAAAAPQVNARSSITQCDPNSWSTPICSPDPGNICIVDPSSGDPDCIEAPYCNNGACASGRTCASVRNQWTGKYNNYCVKNSYFQ